MKQIIIVILLILSCIKLCFAQDLTPKILNYKYGYVDRLGNWVIQPIYTKAGSFTGDCAIVAIRKKKIFKAIANTIRPLSVNSSIDEDRYSTKYGIIDVNGNTVISFSAASMDKIKEKLPKAQSIAAKRRAKGEFDSFYARQAAITKHLDSLQQIREIERNTAIKKKRQRDSIALAKKKFEKLRHDSIANIKRIAKQRADSIAMLKKRHADSLASIRRIIDSIWLAKVEKIKSSTLSGYGISLQKIKIKGDGLLLRKDKTYRTYSITRDDYNRYHLVHDGDMRSYGVLDVKKVIYESDWSLLSDDLFNSVEITKVTMEISRGTRTNKFGVFSFFFTLNLDDLDMIYKDKETAQGVLNSISQIDKYITSFINHYQDSAHFIEPLLQLKIGGKEGITVTVVDKKGKGGTIEDIKRACNDAKRKPASQWISKGHE